jgi:hypothetical protein
MRPEKIDGIAMRAERGGPTHARTDSEASRETPRAGAKQDGQALWRCTSCSRDPALSATFFRLGSPDIALPACGHSAPWTSGSELQASVAVSPSEVPRSAAKRRREVGALHRTREPGERGPRGPWGGKGVPRRGPVGGHLRKGSVPRHAVPVTLTDSAAANEPVAGRAVCLRWARTDLRERRGAIPGAIRPIFPRSGFRFAWLVLPVAPARGRSLPTLGPPADNFSWLSIAALLCRG